MDEQIQAVQNMQEYIESHLQEKITPEQLGAAAGYSASHAVRIFEKHLKMRPAQYIRKLRLSRCAMLLKDGQDSILNLSLSYGYASPEGFQRAFRSEFGTNPSAYEKSREPIWLFIPYKIKYQKNMETKQSCSDQVVTVTLTSRPERYAIIKRGICAKDYWTYSEEVGCDVWGLLKSMDCLDKEPVCLWLPSSMILPGTSQYVQGVEVLPQDFRQSMVPEGFDVIKLPAAAYLMFQSEPFAEENFGSVIETVWKAIQDYDPALIGYAWDDANPEVQLEPVPARGYIQLKSVKPLQSPNESE